MSELIDRPVNKGFDFRIKSKLNGILLMTYFLVVTRNTKFR